MTTSTSVAQRYMNLCDAYLRINEAYAKLDNFHRDLQIKTARLIRHMQANQKNVEPLKHQLDKINQEVALLRQELQEKEECLGQTISNFDQLKGQLQVVQTELSSAQQLIGKLEAENALLRQQADRILGLEAEITALRAQLSETSQAQQVAEARATAAEAALASKNLEIQDLHSKLQATESQLALARLNELELLLQQPALDKLDEVEVAADLDLQVMHEDPDRDLGEAITTIAEFDWAELPSESPEPIVELVGSGPQPRAAA